MHNSLTLIGRIYNITKNNDGTAKVLVSVTRDYKNSEGIYVNDIIPCLLPKYITKDAFEYLEHNDLIGIRGCLGYRCNELMAICDRVTFLEPHKGDKE